MTCTVWGKPLVLILLTTTTSVALFANPEYARRSGKECNYCHPPGNFHLNEAGKYFKEHRSLKGFVPPAKQEAPKQTPPAKSGK